MTKYYTTQEIAELLKVKAITIRRWIINGTLPAIALGDKNKEYRILDTDLERFLDSRRTDK